MDKKAFLTVGITLTLLLTISAIIMVFARGYVLNVDDGNVQQTGILSINSTPSGALIFVNNVPKDVTNNSITGLSPDTYSVRLERAGYHTWNKEVEVKAGEVTNIQSLLISSFPEIKPLTVTGAHSPLLSPDRQKIAYIARQAATQDTEAQNGIWLMDLTGRPFNILNQPKLLVADTPGAIYSEGNIQWGADSENLLIDLPDDRSFVLNTGGRELSTVTSDQRKELLLDWETMEEENTNLIFEQFTDEITALIPDSTTNPVWSPDETKVLYQETLDDQTVYKVLDLRPQEYKGLAKTADETETYTLTLDAENPTKLKWYPDSRHLLLFEEASQNVGQISIIEIEGTNKTSLFSGRVINGDTFPHPDGSKIIFLTNFTSSDDQFNLYSISVY